ncbi:hypothetical protein HOLleu_35865 [Holothuria leucospilota]|uniref:Uncharacterized protein n=1 Tax=Holothuria leucospilota TaxID=206669 RepID=A0A9Q1BD78_HOLLE|nr:hypothetical protein HOLleu_35865 [Holothuria leucospilota]
MQPTMQQHSCRTDQEPGDLWGANARILTGAFQIIFGTLEVILGIIILVELPIVLSDYGLGIFCGVFAITAGCLALFSKRSKGLIVAYMVLSIIAAALGFMCILFRIANFASKFVVISSLVVLFQAIVSIIGASFTCGALSNTKAPDAVQVVQQYPRQPSAPPMTDPPPPYTEVTPYVATTQFTYDQSLPPFVLDTK